MSRGSSAGAEPGSADAQPLPPGAEALLLAARELLIAEGVSGLTVDAVTRKAGLNKAAVSYYFGGKAALVAAVVDLAVQDMSRQLFKAAKELPPGSDRTRFFIEGQQRIAEDEEAYRAWFGMFPFLLTNATVRRRMREAYDWYFELNRECLTVGERVPERDVAALARLMTATVDGLAIQRAVAGDEVDLTRDFQLFGRMVELLVAELDAGRDGGEEAGAPER